MLIANKCNAKMSCKAILSLVTIHVQHYKDKNCSDICVGYLDFDPTTEASERRKFIEYLKWIFEKNTRQICQLIHSVVSGEFLVQLIST